MNTVALMPAHILLSRIVSVLVLLLGSGCQFTPSVPKMRWPWSKETPAPSPDRVLAVWTDTVLHQTGKPGVRGFGGRVYFYEEKSNDPIEVDGGLAIYVFDADKLQSHDQRPLRKFVFTAEQFTTHMSRSSLGPSYSVWLPWGEVGGPPMRLSLIARYESTGGGTTISEPTIKLLPGVPVRSVESEQDLAGQPDGSPYQLVGHTTSRDNTNLTQTADGKVVSAEERAKLSANANPSPTSDTKIKTIDLPPSFQRHFQRNNRSAPPTPAVSQEVPSGLESPTNNPDGLQPAAENSVPATNGISTDGVTTLDAKSLQSLVATTAASPMSTQVIDHRTRMQQRFHNGQSGTQSRVNIREGRWIESLPRISRAE